MNIGLNQRLPTAPLSICSPKWFRADASWHRAVVHLNTVGSSSPSSSFALLAYAHVLASLSVAAKFEVVGLGSIHLHVFSFHHIVFCLIFEPLGLLLPFLLLYTLLFVVSYELQLFFVVCFTGQSCSGQSSSVIHSRLPL